MKTLPESTLDGPLFCSNCGGPIGDDARHVRARVEVLRARNRTLEVETDERVFCARCFYGGVYFTVKAVPGRKY